MDKHADPNPNSSDHDAAVQEALTGDHFVMKMITIFLGVILIGCAITFFLLLAFRGTGESEHAAADSVPASETLVAEPGQLMLAPGEEIVHLAVSDQLLAVHVRGPAGQRILLVDPYTADHKSVMEIVQDAQ